MALNRDSTPTRLGEEPRETQVPIGLLANGTQLRRLRPRGETLGHATFSVKDMTEVPGGPIFAAMHMLLCERAAFLPLRRKQRLPAILADSRKYRTSSRPSSPSRCSRHSTNWSGASSRPTTSAEGELLRDVLADDPNHVYAGLLTVLMRLVFVLYAEDRGLLSSDAVYQKYYAITGLFERLREDAGRHTDTMDHRYGAWAQLLTLFRLIHDGGRHGGMKLLARKGYLFDPDRYPFLEGRAKGSKRHPARDRPAARPRRCRVPRVAQPAHPRTASAELPNARCRADRLGLRDDDGLQPRSRPGPLDRHQAEEGPRCADRD